MKNIQLIDNIFTDCTESSYLFNKVKVFFEINNYILVEDGEKADYIILNTCGVFADIEEKFLRYIDDLYANHGDSAQIIIFGCLPGISQELDDDTRGFIRIPAKQEQMFNEHFECKTKIQDISGVSINEYTIQYPGELFNTKNKKYFLHIARGCIHNCSYCAIKKSIGFVKSEPFEDVIKEFNTAINKGFNEIVLVSDDVGSYGLDIGTSFDVLFNELCKNKGDYLIDINYVEPSTFLTIFPKIQESFHKVSVITIPIQSFTDRILVLMRRKYSVEDYLELLKQMRKYGNSSFKIINHVIFCYPTETDLEFKENLRYIPLFDNTLYTIYSYRRGTKLFEDETLIPMSKKKERLITLVKLNKIYGDKVHLANLN